MIRMYAAAMVARDLGITTDEARELLAMAAEELRVTEGTVRRSVLNRTLTAAQVQELAERRRERRKKLEWYYR
ncbi:MAG TPA: hypothetical protein VIK99_01615 [Thermaerobacter sp.]